MEKNQKNNELTRDQMEKVSGGDILSDIDSDGNINPLPIKSLDGYKCPGDGCNWPLKFIGGKVYRCTNPRCPLFARDQFPAGK